MYNINIIYIRLFYIDDTIVSFMTIDNYKQINKIKTKI